MRKAVPFLAVAGLLAAALPVRAQESAPQAPARTWTSVWGGGYNDFKPVADESGSWHFGSALAAGAGLHRVTGAGIIIGLDASYSRAAYERRLEADTVAGDASIGTLMATGRLMTGGMGGLGMYLTGGAGAFVYGMGDLGRWDLDPAIYTGAGMEYRLNPRRSVFGEWGRFWTFHQREGVDSNSPKHSQIRAGVRLGW